LILENPEHSKVFLIYPFIISLGHAVGYRNFSGL